MRTALLGLICLSLTVAAQAQSSDASFQDEVISTLDATSEKLLGLAEAIPAGTYTWRPAEGVRSVSEAFMHVAAANYFFANMIGTPPPEDVQPDQLETVTDPAAVQEALRASFDHMRMAMGTVEDGDLANTISWFGGSENTIRGALLFITNHASEHTGQLIAYARMNDVTPPWSE